MIPAGDHHTRSLLLRRVSSWSQASLGGGGGEDEDEVGAVGESSYSLLEPNNNSQDEQDENTIENNINDAAATAAAAAAAAAAAHHARQSSLHSLNLMQALLELEQAPSCPEPPSPSSPPPPPTSFEIPLVRSNTNSNNEDGHEEQQPQSQPLEVGEEGQQLLLDEPQTPSSPSIGSYYPPQKCNDIKLYIVFILLVAAGVSNVTLTKLQSVPMYNYPTFLNLYASFAYIPISFAYILPMAKFGSSIPPAHFHMSKRPFMVMGALDSIGACLQLLSSIYLPGKLLVLLPQAAIPLSIGLSRWILREQFTRYQYIGALVVLLGILVVLFPIWTSQQAPEYSCQAVEEFWNEADFCNVCQLETNADDCLSHNYYTDDNDPSSSSYYCQWISKEDSLRDEDVLVFIWSLVMVASCVPMTLSSIYKQVALSTSHANLDPLFVNGWVAMFQFLFAVPLAIPAGLASSPTVTPWQLPENWHHAWQCLFVSHNSLEGGCHPDQCQQAALWVHLGLVSSTAYMVLIIFMLKYGSSALLYMALTLMVPLGHLVFALHDPSSIQLSDVLGLIVLLTGLILYRFGHDNDESQEEEVSSRSGGYFQWLPAYSPTEEAEEDGMYFRFFREPFLLSGDV